MTTAKPNPPGYKPSPLQKAKMVEGFKNRVTSMITGGPKTVPRQTLVGTPPKPAGYGPGKPTVSGIPKPAPSGPLVPFAVEA